MIKLNKITNKIQQMENIENKIIPKGKVYKEGAFWVGSFLGGPLTASYLFAENFKVFGENKKAKLSWIIGIITLIIILGIAYALPGNYSGSNKFIIFLYSGIAYGLFYKFQREKTTQHINAGGKTYSWWRVLFVSIIGAIITLILVLPILYVVEIINVPEVLTKTYGTKVKNEIYYYKSNISDEELDKIADVLYQTGYFNQETLGGAFVEKEGETYKIYLAVLREIENDAETMESYSMLKKELDKYLPENKVELLLVGDDKDDVIKIFK